MASLGPPWLTMMALGKLGKELLARGLEPCAGVGGGGARQAWQWCMGWASVLYSPLYVMTPGGPQEVGMEWGDQSPHRALPYSGRRRVVGASVSLPYPGVEWRREGRGWWIRRPSHNITVITRIAVQDCTSRSEWQAWGVHIGLILEVRHPTVTLYYVLKSAWSTYYVLAGWGGAVDRGSQGNPRHLLLQNV